MSFLEARKTVAGMRHGQPLPFLLAMSGTAEPLDLFVRAAAAQRGRCAQMRALPFNTLAQELVAEAEPGELEVFLLLPWDFVPDADWRSGIPVRRPSGHELRDSAQRTADLLVRRRARRLLYVPAPLPPVLSDPDESASLGQWLHALASSLGARTLPGDTFSLASYLAAGCPFGGTALGRVAEAVVELAASPPTETHKVLVTDLDNVLWRGVMADDGMEGIAFGPEGAGYAHFIFQSLLARLKREGTLLCAVSRNDRAVATEPLRSGRMVLREDDFVAVLASYEPKSAQIEQLASQLNLGLDCFAFVDDNPVELAEVSLRLPAVRCVAFPDKVEALPALCHDLSRLFARRVVTAEDGERTELYRRRLAATEPVEASDTDLTAFLRGLAMKLTISDRSNGDRTRLVQLMNKTNQFNLNGRRVTDEEVALVLADGGRLYGAALEDRHGSHGEILACLVAADGLVRSFVLSCRVFQRRVEHAFLAWLAGQPDPPRQLDFAATARNEPFRRFLADPAFGRPGEGPVRFDAAQYAAAHAAELPLFGLCAPAGRDTSSALR
jgi:FkbH-like protein